VFPVATPAGSYTPDWAIVKGDEARVYLMRETKGSMDELKMRGTESMKSSKARRNSRHWSWITRTWSR